MIPTSSTSSSVSVKGYNDIAQRLANVVSDLGTIANTMDTTKPGPQIGNGILYGCPSYGHIQAYWCIVILSIRRNVDAWFALRVSLSKNLLVVCIVILVALMGRKYFSSMKKVFIVVRKF